LIAASQAKVIETVISAQGYYAYASHFSVGS